MNNTAVPPAEKSVYEMLLDLLSKLNLCVFVISGSSDKIVKVNQALCLFMGKEADELLGESAFFIFDLLKKRNIEVHSQMSEKNGKPYRVVSFSNIVSNLTFSSDESDSLQKRMQKQTKFLGAILESVPDAVVAIDINGIVSSWNKEASELFAWTSSEAIGRHIDSLVLSSIDDEIDSSEVVAGQTIRGFECVRWGKNARKRKVFVSVAPIVVNEVIQGAVGIYTDLTNRDSILALSRENEIKFRAITESAQDAVIMCDSIGLVTFFNSSAERMFGYHKGETIGKKLYEIIAPEVYWDMIEMGFKQFRNTGQGMMIGRVVEMEGKRKNGTTFPVELSVSSFFLNGAWNATGILRDISERKKIELELIEAREGALNAVRTKSEFLANMSHEIRTPLNAIIGTSDLLWETDMDAAQRNYLRVSRNASENLLTLINDILDLSKVEAGRVELEKIKFNLIENVEKVCETLALRAQEKNIELNCWVHPLTPEWVIGDPARLRQVLINLIGNSVKFTEKGEITLHLKPTSIDEVYFSVVDTGIGIPEAKVESIFMSFTQADSSHTRPFGGTGLGLTICSKLVELMEGTIEVESEIGKGSNFFFSCRLPKAQEAENNYLAETESLTGKKILILDSSITNQRIIREILVQYGARVSLASTAHEANEFIQKLDFDSLLVNLTLSDNNGFIVAEQFSTHGVSKNKIILMFNSSDSGLNIKECRKNGINHYLLKPVRRKSLIEQVSNTITQRIKLVNYDQVFLSETEHVGIEDLKLRVLLVEDSADNRFLIEKYTEGLPWELVMAENGQIAYDLFLEDKFDLILMDMQMPIMDGYEATRSIRAYEANNLKERVPIVALTAHALQEEVKECITAGCDIHISKPVRKKVLLSELDSLVQKFNMKPEEQIDSSVSNIDSQIKNLDDFIDVKDSAEQTDSSAFSFPSIEAEIGNFDGNASIQIENPTDVSSLIDESSTQSYVAYVPEDLEPLIAGYLENRRNDVINIKDLLEKGDFQESKRLAHSMKGSGGGYGFDEITEFGAVMEKAAKEEDKSVILANLEKLSVYLKTVRIEYVDEDE